MSDQLDRIEEHLKCQGAKLNTAVADIASVKQTLGGNEQTGQPGLYEDHRNLKTSYYKTKSEVSKLKWIASGIATFISGVWAAIVTWINS